MNNLWYSWRLKSIHFSGGRGFVWGFGEGQGDLGSGLSQPGRKSSLAEWPLMLRYRLPDGRSWKRLWEGWVGSFTILIALNNQFLTIYIYTIYIYIYSAPLPSILDIFKANWYIYIVLSSNLITSKIYIFFIIICVYCVYLLCIYKYTQGLKLCIYRIYIYIYT